MRCVLHTVISNVHIVGCSQGQVSPYGLLFEGGRGHVEIQISQCWGFYLDTGEPQGRWSMCRSAAKQPVWSWQGYHQQPLLGLLPAHRCITEPRIH